MSTKDYREIVANLEDGYRPRWTSADTLSRVLPRDIDTVLDLGCGPGDLAYRLPKTVSTYVGYDKIHRRVSEGRTKSGMAVTLLSDLTQAWDICHQCATRGVAAVSCFAAHEIGAKRLLEMIPPFAYFVALIDLSANDLPNLHRLLGIIGTISTSDPRTEVDACAELLRNRGLEVETSTITLEVTFPTSRALIQYCRLFDVASGADSGIVCSQEQLELQILEYNGPLKDSRHFRVVTARRNERV